MATASELISNRGDANLGLGSNNAIPVITDPDKSGFNLLQETANKMMLQNHANNVNMFRQKIQDRDTLYQALNDGQVKVGEIDPKDRPYYEKAKKAQEKAFYDMAQNGGINNKEAYRKYIQATTDLRETATHVQARKVGIDQYKNDIAKEPIQAKKEQIAKQFQKQYEKDSGAMIDPYQTSLDFDADKLLSVGQSNVLVGSGVPQNVTTQSVRTKVTPGKPTTTTTYQKTTPLTAKGKAAQPVTTVQGVVPEAQTNVVYKNGLPYSVTKQYVDFNKIKQNYNDSFLDKTGEGTELQDQFYDKFTDPNIISHEEIKPTYDYMVKKAEEYNRSRGFTPLEDGSMSAEDLRNGAADTKKLIAAFNVPPDPQTGKRNVNMSKPELASYFALAHMDNFGTQTETLMKDEAALQFQNKKLSEEMKLKYKQLEGQNALRNAQIRKINKSLEGKSDEEQQQVFNKEWAANGATALNLAVMGSKVNQFVPGGVPKGFIPYQSSRAIYTKDLKGNPVILKPIGSKNVYDIVDKDGKPTEKSKVIGYEGGGYRTDFYNKVTGGAIGIENIEQAFTKAKKQNPSLTEQDFLINLGNAGITYRAVGDNNTSTNIEDNGDNLRILNNKFKSKGEQDPIFSDTEIE